MVNSNLMCDGVLYSGKPVLIRIWAREGLEKNRTAMCPPDSRCHLNVAPLRPWARLRNGCPWVWPRHASR